MVEPAYSFSIPSVEDDTPLDCRLYHPKNLARTFSDNQGSPVVPRGAIVAHPFAPLGGCYDDPVVLSVTETLLRQGFVVGTFNFRGASGSHGQTTWSGKGEQEDYISLVGFMATYLRNTKHHPDTYALRTIPSAVDSPQDVGELGPEHGARPIELLLSGYSYGSLILARLPSISTMISRFSSPEIGTAAAEITLRARTLAQQTRAAVDETRVPSSPRGRQLAPEDAASTSPKRINASPMTLGGEETNPSERRRSRDVRRSADMIRKSVELPTRIKAHLRRQSDDHAQDKEKPGARQSTDYGHCGISVRYLLISPVLLPFSHTLSPPGMPGSVFGAKKRSSDGEPKAHFLKHTTLAIFGSSDGFTSSRSMRGWASEQAKKSDSSFDWAEIGGAGHFWREPGVMVVLQQKVAACVQRS